MIKGFDIFERDLDAVIARLKFNDEVLKTVQQLKSKLLELRRNGLVKINHSVMELVCAAYLISNDFEVDLEVSLKPPLTCDLYAKKGDGILIVEVETGFIPPHHALDPARYSKARITSKIARYSRFSSKFALGAPPYIILQLLPVLMEPPRVRTLEKLKEAKELCDTYYVKPPITSEEIRNAHLHTIYIIDVDKGQVREVDPETYWDIIKDWNYSEAFNSLDLYKKEP